MSYFVVVPEEFGNGDQVTMVQEPGALDIGRLAEGYPNNIYFEAFLAVENIEVTIEEKLNDYTKCVVKVDGVIRFIGRNY